MKELTGAGHRIVRVPLYFLEQAGRPLHAVVQLGRVAGAAPARCKKKGWQERRGVFNFLLDTGATLSVLDSSCDVALPEVSLADTPLEVWGVGGAPGHEGIGELGGLYVGDELLPPFWVLRLSLAEVFARLKGECGCTLHGLLGSEFFIRFGATLSYRQRSLLLRIPHEITNDDGTLLC